MFDTLLFTCAMCVREIRDYPNRTGRHRQMAPVCNYCTHTWAKEPSHGSFMDRRLSAQVKALADKLASEAYCKANPIPTNWRDL